MFKDYWYVLVPVHVATSAVWFGGFYALCKSGIDVGAILQTFGASETYVEKLSNSEMGYFALAYACYKIATPVRYIRKKLPGFRFLFGSSKSFLLSGTQLPWVARQ